MTLIESRSVSIQPCKRMDHADERVGLQWDHFESNLGSKFADLRREEHFSDVTLVSEDGQLFKTHKILLSATSPLLDNLLKSEDHPKPLIFLRGARGDLLSCLLDFVYFGQVEVTVSQLEEFVALATDLKVKGLSREDETPVSVVEHLDKKASFEEFVAKDRNNVDETKDNKRTVEVKKDLTTCSPNKVAGNSEAQSFNCNMCEKTSITLKGLEKHKYRAHEFKKEKVLSDSGLQFPCDVCDKTSTSKNGLQKHKIRHHSVI